MPVPFLCHRQQYGCFLASSWTAVCMPVPLLCHRQQYGCALACHGQQYARAFALSQTAACICLYFVTDSSMPVLLSGCGTLMASRHVSWAACGLPVGQSAQMPLCSADTHRLALQLSCPFAAYPLVCSLCFVGSSSSKDLRREEGGRGTDSMLFLGEGARAAYAYADHALRRHSMQAPLHAHAPVAAAAAAAAVVSAFSFGLEISAVDSGVDADALGGLRAADPSLHGRL